MQRKHVTADMFDNAFDLGVNLRAPVSSDNYFSQ